MIIGLSGKKQHGKDTVCKIIQYLAVQYRPEGSYGWNEQQLLERLQDKSIPESFWSSYIWKKKMFAEKLKQIVCLLMGCTMEQLEDEKFKNKELGEEWRVWIVRDFNFENQIQNYLYTSEQEVFTKHPLRYKEISSYILTPRLLLQLLGTECGRQIIHPNIWVNALMSDYRPDTSILGFTGKDTELIYPNWIITDVRFPNEVKAIEDKGGIVIRVTNPRIDSSSSTHESETALDDKEWGYYYNIYNNTTIEALIPKVKEILEYHKII